MDTSKAKSKKTKDLEKRDFVHMVDMEVSHVRCVETKKGDVVFFSLLINGITINGCRVATGKKGDFISFPQTKGKDDNYYSIVYCPLTDEDTQKILDAIQEELNK